MSVQRLLEAVLGADRRLDNMAFLMRHKRAERDRLAAELRDALGRHEVRLLDAASDHDQAPGIPRLASREGQVRTVHPDDVPLLDLGVLPMPEGWTDEGRTDEGLGDRAPGRGIDERERETS